MRTVVLYELLSLDGVAESPDEFIADWDDAMDANLAGVIVSGIEPDSINEVIDLMHNIEVGKLEYLQHPEKLVKLPANEVIGIGPFTDGKRGNMAIFRSREAAEQFVKEDPFLLEGLVQSYEIREWGDQMLP